MKPLALIAVLPCVPIKYELDKEAGTLVVDRYLYTPMRYPGNYEGQEEQRGVSTPSRNVRVSAK